MRRVFKWEGGRVEGAKIGRNWAKMNNKCSSHMYSTVRDHVEGSRKTTTSN
jgi:hypothetical protein